MRVAVIGGGRNCEHEVSLASAASVATGLAAAGHEVVGLTIGRDGGWHDRGGRLVGLAGAAQILSGCDVAFPMVHGPRGEDGALAALCDLARIPWVGSGLGAGALAMDKAATKLVANSVGVATAPGRLVTRSGIDAVRWSRPVVVKPVCAGSSHGVALVDHALALRPALENAFAVDDRVLVEEVVVGREVDVAVWRRADGSVFVPPALEIVGEGIFDLATKYDGSADLQVPADLTDTEAAELRKAAVAMVEALGCRGVARVDFFLTAEGPVLNEVNTIPGMTAASQAPRMFAAAGIGYAELLDLLVRDAVPARLTAEV
ncbi:D-alanine--D-alanine ligase [Nocardioides sp. R-C-SC26]|uniref:D-alanine--D-alanine ligase family protein n=1 Tax=Nocardioides sp. R-C-SC26 TaxID=2870414 RepID=UPI001E3E985D|nr:D-alanine--D-alanine ligase [Nocardioides sp. R-C-SC26]